MNEQSLIHRILLLALVSSLTDLVKTSRVDFEYKSDPFNKPILDIIKIFFKNPIKSLFLVPFIRHGLRKILWTDLEKRFSDFGFNLNFSQKYKIVTFSTFYCLSLGTISKKNLMNIFTEKLKKYWFSAQKYPFIPFWT